MSRINSFSNWIQIPLSYFNFKNNWSINALITTFKYGNIVVNGDMVSIYFYASTITEAYLFPILLGLVKHKVIVLIILAFL